MKKSIFSPAFFAVIFGITSCDSEVKKTTNDSTKKEVISEENNTPTTSLEQIDKIRAEIEKLEIKPIEISTTGLREKVKQKWSKIHFYVKDNEVVKVKTYPHSTISKRTEEFYANEMELLLVVIEDNGEGKKGKKNNEIEKMYYFNSGKLVKETNMGNEKEYTIKNSDSEELLSEFEEYLEIYKNSIK